MEEPESNNQEQEPKQEEDIKGSLERISESLTSRQRNVTSEQAAGISKTSLYTAPSAPTSWQPDPTYNETPEMKKKKKKLHIFVAGAAIFFLITVAFAAYIFIGGSNQVSPDNIHVSLVDSPNISAGKPYDFTITIQNDNTVELQNASLVVTYPIGTRTSTEPHTALQRETRSLGSITSNSIIKKDFSAIFYGEKGETKILTFVIQYQVVGSDTPFVKTEEVPITIDDSLVSLVVSVANQYESGTDMEATVSIVSNTDTTIQNLILVAEYPFGFTYKSADREPLAGDNIWSIGDIKPGETKEVRIRGAVNGTNNDERTLRVRLGIAGGRTEIASLISETSRTYSIKEPLFNVVMELNGKESGDTNVSMGDTVFGSLRITNNLTESIENVKVSIDVPTALVNEKEISVDSKGTYRSLDKQIIWDKSLLDSLARILPGESIKLSFSIKNKGAFDAGIQSVRNPHYTLSANASGVTVGDVNGANTTLASAEGLVKINSILSLTSNSYYARSGVPNAGPLPPRVNQKTIYAIRWSLTNAYNSLTNTVVSASLPPYIEWVGAQSPASENVSFDENARTLSWNVGRLPAGVGQNTAPAEVTFYVALTPTLSQEGSAPTLVQDIKADARDEYTNSSLSVSREVLTTFIVNDPAYVYGIEKVVQ